MNVIAKVSGYFECSVVTPKLRKEYLNTVTCNIAVLLQIKYWTVWCIERYSVSTYTGVSNFQKTVRFFGPPCTYGTVGIMIANEKISVEIFLHFIDMHWWWTHGVLTCDDFSRLVDFCISSVHSVAFHAHWIICVRNVALVCGTVAMCQPSSVLETTRMAFVLRPSREKHREMIHYKCRQKMLILSNSVLT